MWLCDVTFKTLDQIDANDQTRIGGKAYNCARLKQAGVPVPDAIVVPTDASDECIRAIASDPWLATVPSDARFAVRSSGIGEDSTGHSFAGIHETQLNVERNQLVEAVLLCRRSADTEQARAYRRARGIGDEAAQIGVLVQLMVPAVTSGVAFTLNPVTGADELVINAASGLGEALVSGLVTPDEYRLRKSDLLVLESRMGTKSGTNSVNRLDLAALGAMLLRIEQHYGAPQDVEWCHDGRQFWIVQSRPVTTQAKAEVRSEKLEVRRTAPDLEWTRANLAEVLPDQLSPQALDLYERDLNSGQRRFFGRLMGPESTLGPMVKAFHGRLYFNLSQMRHITAVVGAPFANALRSMGHSEQIRPEDEIKPRVQVRDLVRALPDLLRLVINGARTERIFRNNQEMTERSVARLSAEDPRTMSDREIWSTFEWWLSTMPETLTTVLVMSSVQMHEDVLRNACQRVGMAYEDLVYPQLAAGERSVSTQQAIDLVELANAARDEPAAKTYLLADQGTFVTYRSALARTMFLRKFDRFLEMYGHRGRYESDWALPRLHEDPAPALFAIQGQLQGEPQDPAVMAERQERQAADAWQAFDARLTRWQKLTLGRRVRATLRRLKRQYVWRERVRSDLVRVLSKVREWHLALADRFVERGWLDRRDDYFLLRIAEVQRACEDPAAGLTLRAIAFGRAATLASERDLQMPLFMRESELTALLHQSGTPVANGSDAMTGLCVSPGSIEAEVVVMRDPSEFANMKRGAILVTTATDPSWTPLFTLASGVIVEVGGMLSHASTIAREYGLPALANVKDATRRLKTGDRVRLDASAGVAIIAAGDR
jgi:pyruvate,water dikinase